MLTIRLFRVGKKRQPTYKIVVTDKKNPPSAGRFVEEIGFYNPLTKERKINKERALYWINNGAQQSDTVYNFLVTDKVIEGKKKPKHKVAKKEVENQESQVKVAAKEEVTSEEKETVKENNKEEIKKEDQESEKKEVEVSEDVNKETKEEKTKEEKTEEIKIEEVKTEDNPEKEELAFELPEDKKE